MTEKEGGNYKNIKCGEIDDLAKPGTYITNETIQSLLELHKPGKIGTRERIRKLAKTRFIDSSDVNSSNVNSSNVDRSIFITQEQIDRLLSSCDN